LPLVATLAHQPFWISSGTRIVIYALAAVGLDLLVGYGALVSFGHAAYFALGGYVVAILASNGVDSALVTWPCAVLAAAALAALVGALSLRTTGVFFIMITLAFAQMVYFAIIAVRAYGGGDGFSLTARSSLPLIDLRDPIVFYGVCLVALCVFTYLASRIVGSRFGMILRGAAQSERRLTALGFPVFRYRLVAFIIAGSAAGLSGALWAEYAKFVSPDMASWSRSGEFLVMVILGGMGSLVGAVYGAAALLGLESVLAGFTEHWMIVLGALLVTVVLFAKRGLFGWLAGTRSDG